MNLPISGFFSTPELIQSLQKILKRTASRHFALGFSAIPARPLDAEVNDKERHYCQKLSTLKRQREWLAGRLSAKRASLALLQAQPAILAELGLNSIPKPADITVQSLQSGAPKYQFPLSQLGVSITHSGPQALSLCTHELKAAIDIEQVRTQKEASFRFYLRPSERLVVLKRKAAEQSAVPLRYFSIKEAIYKLLEPPRGYSIGDIEILQKLGHQSFQAVFDSIKIHGRLGEYVKQQLKINPNHPAIVASVSWNGRWLFSCAAFQSMPNGSLLKLS